LHKDTNNSWHGNASVAKKVTKIHLEGDIFLRPTDKNFFSGSEIYFKGLEIYFSAFEIYFQALEIVLLQASEIKAMGRTGNGGVSGT